MLVFWACSVRSQVKHEDQSVTHNLPVSQCSEPACMSHVCHHFSHLCRFVHNNHTTFAHFFFYPSRTQMLSCNCVLFLTHKVQKVWIRIELPELSPVYVCLLRKHLKKWGRDKVEREDLDQRIRATGRSCLCQQLPTLIRINVDLFETVRHPTTLRGKKAGSEGRVFRMVVI